MAGEDFERLLQAHLPLLKAFVRLRAGEAILGKESASDLVQTVCREALEAAPKFEVRGPEAFRKWLLQRALHKLIDRRRFYGRDKRDVAREVRARETVSASDAKSLLECYGTLCTPSRDAIANEEVERIERALEQLDGPQREAILLCRIAGLSFGEAGEQTGRSANSVRGLMNRGLARLARLLTGPVAGA
jgi:RNA polymerase sigma factor (sigma-70 family)